SGGKLSGEAEPDGGLTTFTYDGAGKLSRIDEPGGRTVTVTVNGSGDLSQITNPDGNNRSFTYDANHKATNQQWGPSRATSASDAGTAPPTTISLDASPSLRLKVAPAQALQTSPAVNASGVAGVLTDALSHATTYPLDPYDRLLQLVRADGASRAWNR